LYLRFHSNTVNDICSGFVVNCFVLLISQSRVPALIYLQVSREPIMRWCTNNHICRFLCRHIQAVVLILILILCANKVINFSRDRNSPICYKIVSPFNNHNNNDNGVINLSFGSQANETGKRPLLPDIPWSQARLDDRRMVS
jgi:hypothetical protein